jgi:putative heme-binding domain-containing protein
VRLVCDERKAAPALVERMTKMAREETNREVSCQLACSARRLPAADCLKIVRGLLESSSADDARFPLLVWWAIESQVNADAPAVVDFFREPAVWRLPIVERDLAERLMRRFAATGRRKDLIVCAELLQLAPDSAAVKKLMAGFETAYAGRSLTNLPAELAAAMEKFSGSSVALGLRQGRPDAVAEALKTLTDERADKTKSLQYVQIFGEVSQPACVPILIDLATRSPDNALQAAALRALGRYDEPRIAAAVIDAYGKMNDDVRAAAGALLASRPAWTLALLEAIDAHGIEKSRLSSDLVQRMAIYSDDKVAALVRKHWPDLKPATSDELKRQIDRVAGALQSGLGQPKPGKAIFLKQCGKCHALFGEGGQVGPDLTAFNRNDLQAMLLSIVNPNAEIREGYNAYRVMTDDGRIISGILADQDAQIVSLRSAEGTSTSIARDEIDEMTVSPQSMMPERLLNGYTDQQLRDLFGYLRMTQPLID